MTNLKRFKSIDIIRGFSIFLMVAGHSFDWWLRPEDHWLITFLISVFMPAAIGFLFISGVSASLSYNKNLTASNSDKQRAKNLYLLRAMFLMIIAFLFNIPTAIVLNDPSWIWAWNVLQTVAFSLFIAWPLLKISKVFRLIIGSTLIILNEYILAFLMPYQGQSNLNGFLFHILYNPVQLYVIIPFFASFLIGTVIGEILFNINSKSDEIKRSRLLKKAFIYPLLVIGLSLIIAGLIYRFPDFFLHATFSNLIYSIGVLFSLLSILIYIEEYHLIKVKKSYRFFFYYSYYSITIYISHYIMIFFFWQQLNKFSAWPVIIGMLIIFSIIVRAIYNKWGMKASVKVGITVLSFIIINNIEKKSLNEKKIDNVME